MYPHFTINSLCQTLGDFTGLKLLMQYLINSIRFLSQICPRYSFPCARHWATKFQIVSQKNQGVTS
jgi:hypothetical protein